MASSKFQVLWNHPAGPKTSRFWTPFKWGIIIANVDNIASDSPPEKISYPLQASLACSGLIGSRYCSVITPKNWNLLIVNIAMAGSSLYLISRKVRHDYFSEQQAAAEIAEE